MNGAASRSLGFQEFEFLASLTGFDMIVLALIGGGAIMGFMRGFAQEALSLMAWAAAVVALRLFHTPVTEWLIPKVGTESGAMVLAFFIVFGGVLGLGKFIARKIGKTSRDSVVVSFDRVLGVGFGMLKGLVLSTIGLLLFFMVFDFVYGADAERPAWLRDSRTYPLLRATGVEISDMVKAQQEEEKKQDRLGKAN